MTRVIVVDDEENIRTVLSRWLKSWDYDVWTAASADDALELMTTRPAEIVLCDVMMPVRGTSRRSYFIGADPLQSGPGQGVRHFAAGPGDTIYESTKRVAAFYSGVPPLPAVPIK